jgi:nitrogen fixation protein FixH
VTLSREGVALQVAVTPNAAHRWNTVELRLRQAGKPLRRKRVQLRFEMPAMSMGVQRFGMKEERPGVYRYHGPAISMPGVWRLTFEVHAVRGRVLSAAVQDRVRG